MKWSPTALDEEGRSRAVEIADSHALAPAMARALAARGLTSTQVEALLRPSPHTVRCNEVDAIAGALNAKLHDGEIGILCDYDVDGATSAGILTRAIQAVWPGNTVPRSVPERNREGFGPNERCLKEMAEHGVQTLIVLDCGADRGKLLKAWYEQTGIVSLVIDHHPATEQLRPREPCLMLNPKADAGIELDGACTARLAMEVARSLLGVHGQWNGRVRQEIVWLAGVGTMCDMMPIADPTNRALVMTAERLPVPGGLEDLAEGETANARQFGWRIGPVLNAGSRMGESALASRLLCSASPDECKSVLGKLIDLNDERKRQGRSGQAQFQAMREELMKGPVNVVVWEDGTAGAAGPAASRIVDEYGWPAIVVCPNEASAGLGGSGRSALGFDLGGAIRQAVGDGLLINGGGHAQACGLSVETQRVQELREYLAERITSAGTPSPVIRSDATLEATDLEHLEELVESIERIAPYGAGHERVRFEVRRVRLSDLRETQGGHVFVRAECDGIPFEFVKWNPGPGWTDRARSHASKGGKLRIIGEVERSEWKGRVTHRLVVWKAGPEAAVQSMGRAARGAEGSEAAE